MGLKPRTTSTAATTAALARVNALEAELAAVNAALAKERERARYLEVELQETTDKYQELTRKSVDFEEDKADVEQERDEAVAERDEALKRSKTLQMRVDALEKETSWAHEDKRKLAAAQKKLAEMATEVEILRERASRPQPPPRARTVPGAPTPPRPAAPTPPEPMPAATAASRLPLEAPAFDEDEDTHVDKGPLIDRFDVGRDRDD